MREASALRLAFWLCGAELYEDMLCLVLGIPEAITTIKGHFFCGVHVGGPVYLTGAYL